MSFFSGDSTPSTEKGDERVDKQDFDKIRVRMEEYDEKREYIIKQSRDAQKASKQAIFSVHRGQLKPAESQLEIARKVLQEMSTVIEKEPELRYGAYAGAVEEFAEGILFCTWFRNDHVLLRKDEIPFVKVQEYLGALSDFTGEVGRFAVICATKREREKVDQCLSVVQLINSVLECACLNNKWFSQQKSVAIKTNLKKIQSLVYDLTVALKTRKESMLSLEMKDSLVATFDGPRD
eukprot:TRINITY_DN6085_c0_g1_i5.p1 TRINITY_DN6085_c0_g1~~TRINITY_DN6085_c0_g1_i5.p1  ORF type:complete len:236 (+),score=66.62 TRINITY_DN6085_c0_g1_i5:497-1204(+)